MNKPVFKQVLLLSVFALTSHLSATVFAQKIPNSVDPRTINFRPNELNSCQALRKRSITNQRNYVYDKVFSSYVEVCAGSTWQKRGASDGGNYGHAFLMIRGACIVRDSQGKPTMPRQIKACKDGVVGISTDYAFGNIQWLATEGRDLFLYGDHAPNQPLDTKAWRAIQQRVLSQGIMNGVHYKMGSPSDIQDQAKKAGQTTQDYITDWATDMSMGTDFALAASRGGIACTRIPLVGSNKEHQDQPLQDLIASLNKFNKDAYTKGFDYDGLVNSCSTTVHNSLADLGLWKKTNSNGHPTSVVEILQRLDDMPSPFLDTFDSYKIGSQIEVEGTLNKLRSNPAAFAYFKKTGWLFRQFGTMLDEIHPLEYRNEIYNTENNTNFATLPYFIWSKIALLPKQIPIIGNLVPDIKLTTPIFQSILADRENPAVNLVRNFKIWNEQYAIAMAHLEHSPNQDEVTQELKKYYRNKFRETLYLYGKEKELTADMNRFRCGN